MYKGSGITIIVFHNNSAGAPAQSPENAQKSLQITCFYLIFLTLFAFEGSLNKLSENVFPFVEINGKRLQLFTYLYS